MIEATFHNQQGGRLGRPIKLRAWDEQAPTLTPVTIVAQLTDPRLVITQFTGVADAAGQEVWEGDILRLVYIDESEPFTGIYHYLVVFEHGCFGTRSADGHEFTPFVDQVLSLGQVVGNRFRSAVVPTSQLNLFTSPARPLDNGAQTKVNHVVSKRQAQ